MDEQCLHGIACSRVVTLGIHHCGNKIETTIHSCTQYTTILHSLGLTYLGGLGNISMLVHIYMTYSLSVSQHWNAALILVHDTAHKSIAPARNDQVYSPLHPQQFSHLLTTLHLNTKYTARIVVGKLGCTMASGYGDCTILWLMTSFRGQSPRKDILNQRMVQHHPMVS